MHQGVLPVPSAGIWASIWNSLAGSAAHAAGPERCVPMLIRNLTADHIYLVCGYTDMRKSIDGLAALVAVRFHLDSHQPVLFLFYGRRKDRIKVLFVGRDWIHSAVQEAGNGRYQWPNAPEDLVELSQQQLRWLTEGLSIHQPKAVQTVHPSLTI